MATKLAIAMIVMNGQSKTKLERLCQQRGMRKVVVISRLVNWLVGQDDTVQAIVLGSVSEEMLGPLTEKLLQRLADQTARK